MTGDHMVQAHVLSENEKREFFRIDDMAVLQVRQVSEEEMMTMSQHQEQQALNRLTVLAQFEGMSREIRTLTKVIGKSSSNIANCLDMLDTKINTLGECIVASEMASMGVEPQNVNISAGGLSFISTRAILSGTTLELRMILLPDHIGIFSYARVVNCVSLPEAEEKGNRYRVSVEFLNMEDDVRDLITRHVLQKEQQKLMKKSDAW